MADDPKKAPTKEVEESKTVDTKDNTGNDETPIVATAAAAAAQADGDKHGKEGNEAIAIPEEAKAKEVVLQVPAEVAKVAVDDDVAEGAEEPDDDDGGIGASASKRRFFPRVKHLLTREWEYFLAGVLDAMETVGAHATAAASHKASNPWYKAFDIVYGGVAADCSIPTGKNRYHKFKDKIVELWTAMETQAPQDHPLRPRAVSQLNTYRKACEDQPNSKKEFTFTLKMPINDDDDDVSRLVEKPPINIATGGGMTTIQPPVHTKRSYAAAMPNAGVRWKYLDESDALSKLPQPLQSLIHLRHLAGELRAQSTVEASYQKALQTFIRDENYDKFDKALSLVFLHRQAQSAQEFRDILRAYERTVAEYLESVNLHAVEI